MWFELIKAKAKGHWNMIRTNKEIEKYRKHYKTGNLDTDLASANKETKITDNGGTLMLYAPMLELEIQVTQDESVTRLNRNVTIREIENQARRDVNKKLKEKLGKGWIHLTNVEGGSFQLWNKEHHHIYRKLLKMDTNPLCETEYITWLKKPDKKNSTDMDDLYVNWGNNYIGINKKHGAFYEFKDAMSDICSDGSDAV